MHEDIQKVNEIAELVRREPYRFLTNDCIIKSIKVKRRCRSLGINVKVVICIGTSRAIWFGKWLIIPVIHGWIEYRGQRIETSRPLGVSGIWNIIPVKIKPVIAIKF